MASWKKEVLKRRQYASVNGGGVARTESVYDADAEAADADDIVLFIEVDELAGTAPHIKVYRSTGADSGALIALDPIGTPGLDITANGNYQLVAQVPSGMVYHWSFDISGTATTSARIFAQAVYRTRGG
jgi:hypothetical protein